MVDAAEPEGFHAHGTDDCHCNPGLTCDAVYDGIFGLSPALSTDATKFCVQATDRHLTDIRYYATTGMARPQAGSCPASL